jgi:hypothetical protein
MTPLCLSMPARQLPAAIRWNVIVGHGTECSLRLPDVAMKPMTFAWRGTAPDFSTKRQLLTLTVTKRRPPSFHRRGRPNRDNPMEAEVGETTLDGGADLAVAATPNHQNMHPGECLF